MSVFRIEKTKDYTVMSNFHLKEKEMSLKAKGLLSLMLSLPDNWNYSMAGLVAICKENETAVKTALDELQEFGYLKIIKKMPDQTKSGRIEYEYVIYEQKQEGEKQGIENLGVEFQGIENQRQLNNNKLNTNRLNIKDNYYHCIINYLNDKAGTHYKVNTPKTIRLINARLNEGFLLEEFEKAIDNMVYLWKDNTKMRIYLRPETLFGTKMESYVNIKIDKPRYEKQVVDKLYDNLEDLDL